MNGNIIGEPIEDFVQVQIGNRQLNQFSGYGTPLRTDDQLKYLSNRNAWIKLASSVDVRVDTILGTQLEDFISLKLKNIGLPSTGFFGTQLAEKAVLFNTISEYTSGGVLNNNGARAGVSNTNDLWSDSFIYGIGGTDFGIQPPPGIIGVTVDSINRGSIRKANITLKAHNKFQFGIIELLYLRLGFTMMLEWGWDKYLDNKGVLQQTGNTIIEEEWFKTNGVSQLEMLKYIQTKRKDYNGNYDGFFGKVSNFTWSFNPDGSYDISIDLITLGDVIESLKVNTSTKEKFYSNEIFLEEIKFKEELKSKNLENTNIAKAATLNTIGYFLYKKIKEISDNNNTNTINYITLTTKDDTAYKSPQYYIRLSEFLTELENRIIPKVQNDGKTSNPQIIFEKFGCFISYFPNQIPLDPRVCIFKPSLNSYGDITGVNTPSYLNKPIMVPYIFNKGENTYGLLTSLYINFEFIAGLLTANGGPDQEIFLFKFLQDLCNGINDALGGVNKLEPVIKDDYIVTIIDQTLSDPQENIINLEIYGYNPDNQTSNFVKDVKFVSKITPQLASMISIGATAAGSSTSEIDGTAFSKFSEGLVDRFALEILEPKGTDIEDKINQKTEQDYKRKFDNEFKLADQSFGATIDEADESFKATIADLQLGIAKVFGTKKSIKERNAFSIYYNALDDDLGERRIVIDPFNKDINNTPMYFKEYYEKSLAFEIQRKKEGKYTINEINELTSTNYIIYLIKAFGGITDQIKVQFQNYDNIQSGTGFSSIGRSLKNSSTTKNLQIDPNQNRYQEFDETFISQGKSAYKTYINTLNNNRYKIDNIPSSEVGFIPLSFELTLDGISGIKIYNKLNINNEFLPSNYPESLSFIITKVNHNISNNSWDTSLSTISIPKTEPYKYKSVPAQTNTSGGGNTDKIIPIRPTPNADYLRGVLRQLGYTEKGTELSENGDISSELAKVAESVFRMFKKRYPKNSIIVTAGNDAEHSGFSKSSHPKGNGIDFVITGTTKKIRTEQIDADLAIMAFLNPGFRFRNEYEDKSAAASVISQGGGDHYHFSWNQAGDGTSTTMTKATKYATDKKLEAQRFTLNPIYYIKF